MLPLRFNLPARRPPRLLFLGAHCDDIEIGCGGTVIDLLRRHPRAEVRWVVFGSDAVRAREAHASARRFVGPRARCSVTVHAFRTSYFPMQWEALKGEFEALKTFRPDVIFTHHGEDRHQDHRVVSELTWNTFRDHMVLEYEIPKYDAGLTSPAAFCCLTAAQANRKARLIVQGFPSQRAKQWFSTDTFLALARLRGIECNAPAGYAEGFHVRKLVF